MIVLPDNLELSDYDKIAEAMAAQVGVPINMLDKENKRAYRAMAIVAYKKVQELVYERSREPVT